LERGGIIPSSPPHPKKKHLEKIKIKIQTPFFLTPFTTCNYFDLIELSTPYTH
jgi:hypothetical protein